jgi:ATP-dependent DNA helicase RecG
MTAVRSSGPSARASKGPRRRIDAPLADLHGVGARRAADLAKAGLVTLEDLLLRFPIRYEDRSSPQPIAALKPGGNASVVGEVIGFELKRTRRPGFTIFELRVRDDSGTLTAVFFNQRFLRDVFHRHQQVALFGKVELTGHGVQMASPQYEILADAPRPDAAAADAAGADGADTDANANAKSDGASVTLHHGRIVPIYERVGSLTAKVQRTLVAQAIERISGNGSGAGADDVDPIPTELRAKLHLPARVDAFRDAHFPDDETTDVKLLNAFRSPAQVRLIFEEFFLFQLGVAMGRRALEAERKPFVPKVDDRIREAARALLPFSLTTGQKTASREIVGDMTRPQPMNRLLQGDVGVGKTIVALLAALVALENDLQVAFMAPTEILAEQHAMTIARLFASTRFRVAALTGSTSAAERRRVIAGLARGDIHLAIGTHALLQDDVAFKALGLVIIDEQHRFGVVQRSTLRQKGNPDVLVMTATPIPRTLALTTYGDLDVSVIRDGPAGRKPIKTTVRPESRRDEVWEFVRAELEKGRQAYVVYPLIDDSEKVDLRPATAMAEHLSLEVFPDFRVALLHGKMKSEEKERVMAAFVAGHIHLLVSTTVVEVGVDVPNATVMVVEHAERFGLSQLHQLRGRVGRADVQSHCVLLYQTPLSDDAKERLKAMAETTDGFVLAEKDLALRGPGDFCGTRQSGLPTLRIGDLMRDQELMEQAREAAREWLSAAPANHPVLALARDSWTTRFGLIAIG